MFQMREKDKNLRKRTKNNTGKQPTPKEFKVRVIKMDTKLRSTTDEHGEN